MSKNSVRILLLHMNMLRLSRSPFAPRLSSSSCVTSLFMFSSTYLRAQNVITKKLECIILLNLDPRTTCHRKHVFCLFGAETRLSLCSFPKKARPLLKDDSNELFNANTIYFRKTHAHFRNRVFLAQQITDFSKQIYKQCVV